MVRVFTQTFGVAGAIIEEEGKFLLVQEAGCKGGDQGKWNHPAGWIEVGEDPIEAVKREVEEETGFSFIPKKILGIYSLVREDKREEMGLIPHPIKIIYVGDISKEIRRELADDVIEAKWFYPEEIYSMDKETLRDSDIKIMIRDYLTDKRFPLDILTHTISS